MTFLQSILLGIVQGITEFLPISSSAHLVLVPFFFGWKLPPSEVFIFDVLVQVASLIAVIAFYWHDLINILSSVLRCIYRKKPFDEPEARLGWLLVLATIPAGLIGLILKDLVEQAFASPPLTAFFLLITAGILFLAEKLNLRKLVQKEPGWRDALWIGLAQALAIFPGISRSGSTIAGGMMRGLSRPAAARFAFLMSVPIMMAAGLSATMDLHELKSSLNIPLVFIPGLITSGVVSYFSIRWLLGYITRKPLYIFSAYCCGLAVLSLIVSSLK